MIPQVLLDTIVKLHPKFQKTTVYRILEWMILLVMFYGVYSDASGSLLTAKANRDEQIKGYSVQIGVNHQEVFALKEEVQHLREWNKDLSNRVNRLEDIAIRGHDHAVHH